MEEKRESLESIKPADSGLIHFDNKKFEFELKELEEAKSIKSYNLCFYKLYGLLLRGKYEDFISIISNDPSLVASIEIKALIILEKILTDKEILEKDIFPFASAGLITRKKISDKIARDLTWLIKASYHYSSSFLAKFPELQSKIWNLAKLIPEIVWHYSLFLLEENLQDYINLIPQKLSELKISRENLLDPDELEKSKKLEKIWEVFLLGLYYRRIGDQSKAEEKLVEYREAFDPEILKPVQIESFGNESFYKPEDILANWSKVLTEIDKIQQEVELLAGLENQTCAYFKCSDCCSNTFPVMSLTEFKYLENWLKENNYDLEKIHQRANAIQEEHQKLYGSKLEIVDKSQAKNMIRGIENPHRFRFTCPFLENGRCSVHSARPLICRGFGESTENDISIKTCNFYQAQYRANTGPENKRYAYDMRLAQMLARSSDKHLVEGKELKATIAAWFSNPDS